MRKQLVCLSWAALSFLPGCFASVVVTTNAADFAARPVQIDFDSIAPGADITNQVVNGVRFIGPGAPLIVVSATSTYTPAGFTDTTNIALNVLPATTGRNVLSPGGAMLGPGNNPAIEKDWLTLEFINPVVSFGFDHLSQSADGVGFTLIRVFDTNGGELYNGSVPVSNLGGGGAPGGADFWGIIASGGTRIGRVEIQELDADGRYPDANIGFDSMRYEPVPEPSSLALAGVGLAAAAVVRHRRAKSA